MFNKSKLLLACTVASVMTLGMSYAMALETTTTRTTSETTIIEKPVTTGSTVTTQTTVRQQPATGTRLINFMDFDINGDRLLSTNEVGEFLFKLYDTDGNEVIDNNEYERKAVFTMSPMEKNTITTYDFDNDGIADKQVVTYETFLRESQLARFDLNHDGLSPHEFTGMHFNEADVNNDHAVEMKEWRGVYIASINKKNQRDAETNK